MLLLGLRNKNYGEVFGKFVRLGLSVPGSILRRYPVGNTGRSNVNMFQPMAIPDELQGLLEELNQ